VTPTLARNPNPQSQPNDGAPTDGISAVPADSTEPITRTVDRQELLENCVAWYKASRDHYQQQRQEMAEAFDYRAGHQWTDEDLQILQDQMRPAITFNRIGPFVDAVGGLEINNRQQTVYIPRQVGASGVNDLLTAAGQWARQECDAEDEETEAFLDAVTCGWGVTQTRMDYDTDPDGMPVIEHVDPLEMFPDAQARKQNLSDMRHVLRVKDVPLPAAEELFPDVDPVLLHAQWAEDQPDATRSPHNARLAPYYRIDQSGDIDRNEQLVRLVEVEWWSYEPAYRVLDPMTGRWVMLSEEKARVLTFRARVLGQRPEMIRDRKRVYRKAIVGAEVLKVMDGAEAGGFSYKFITAKRDRNRGTWYGLIRAMMDPQRWANKWVSQGLHILNTNAKGGLIIETDAAADIEELRDTWAEADSITEVNPGGIAKLKQKEPPAFPQQLNAMMDMAVNAIPAVSGINMELMGQSTSQQPQVALLEAGRRQQGMNVLAGLFNAMRRYHKEQGRLMLWMIQEYVADGRLIRIGGPENARYVPLVHEPGVAEYDVIVDDAPTSPNMKDKVWNALMQLFPLLRGMSIPPQFYVNALKYAPVPASFVAEAQGILSQPSPPNPAQQGIEAVNASRAALHAAQADKIRSETARDAAEAQTAPAAQVLDLQQKQATIEKTRADAINALQNAGITLDDHRFQQTVAAIDALLRVHGAALDHVQGLHDRQMAEQQPAQPAPGQAPLPQPAEPAYAPG
jgi:hypothetical protein